MRRRSRGGHVAGGLVISAAGDFSSGRFARLTGHVHVGGGGGPVLFTAPPCWTDDGVLFHTALYYSITGQTAEVPGSPGGLSSPSQQLPPQ